MYSTLLEILNTVSPISEPLRDKLTSYLQTKEFKKKSYILREGQVCNYTYFIEKGLVRSFYIEDGEEVCSWFMKENDFIVSVNSFFTRNPSHDFIEALEDTTVHMLHYNNLQALYREFVEFNIAGRLITEKYYVLSEERSYALRKHKAEEMYEILLRTQPEIIPRVPRKYIASYLGISLETLSRIGSKKVQ